MYFSDKECRDFHRYLNIYSGFISIFTKGAQQLEMAISHIWHFNKRGGGGNFLLCIERIGNDNTTVFNLDEQEVTDNKSVLSLPVLPLFSIQISVGQHHLGNFWKGVQQIIEDIWSLFHFINMQHRLEWIQPLLVTESLFKQQHGSLAATELFCRNERIMLSFHHKHKAA